MDNISLEIFNEYNRTVDRYFELYPSIDKEKLETAAVIIAYSLNDINIQVNAYNREEKSVSIFYQLIIKTDLLIGSVNFLFNTFMNNKNEKVATEVKTKIEKFRLIRNLTIAHPLSTTKFEEHGFGKDNDKWCEDVCTFKPYMKKINNNVSADYVLMYKERGEESTQKMFITVQEYIIDAANVVLTKLDSISKNLNSQIDEKVYVFRKTPISATKELSIDFYIEKLKEDLIIRYPAEINKYQVEEWDIDDKDIDFQNFHPKQSFIEESLLNDAFERINLEFSDPKRASLYGIYIKKIQDAIYNYGDSI